MRALRLPLVLPMLLSLTTACGDGGGGSGAPRRAAVLGTASSPALDALRPLLRVADVPDDEADLLVADCKVHPPGSLAANARLQAFLADGRPVLFLDASQAHGLDDVVPLVHGSHAGEAHALLVRRALDPHGRPELFVYAFPGPLLETPSSERLDAFRAGAEHFFARAEAPPALGNGFDPPPGLLYVIYNFTIPPTWYEFTATKDGTDSTNGVQWTSYVSNYRYTVLLENGAVASGDRQFVVAETSTEASPLNAEQGTNKLMITKTGSAFVTTDIGWFQVEIDVTSAPQGGPFVFQTSAPQNANRVTTVNSRIAFGIDFLTPTGGSGNFGFVSNDSTELTDWEVVNLGNGSDGSWAYRNQNPWLWDSPSTWDDLVAFGNGIDFFGSFKKPNDLAADQIQALTKMVWATTEVLRIVQSFVADTTVTYLNVWSPPGTNIHHGSQAVPAPATWTIAMQAVLPIPFASLSFSPNPVNAAAVQAATGTVVLEDPAFVDTTIYLSSNSVNATVLPSVTIPQGATSATFQVLVNTNDLPSGGSTVATIQAFNAEAIQTQLTVTNE